MFCSDLDNTLIYSYKHEIGGDRRCVEVYEGREASFITSYTLDRLRLIQGLLNFVPTTTRTVEQYQRIRLGVAEPEYALACNGGELLIKGARDKAWYEESLRLISQCAPELKKAAKCLDRDADRCFEVRDIDGLFLFTKSREPEKTAGRLREILDPESMGVFTNGIKVYAVPRRLNKGDALKRLKERLKVSASVAAGDSEFDIPMLEAADKGFLPRILREKVNLRGAMTIYAGERVFSEEIVDGVLRWMGERQTPQV